MSQKKKKAKEATALTGLTLNYYLIAKWNEAEYKNGEWGCWDSGVFLAQVWDLFPITPRDSSTDVLCLPLVGTAGSAADPVSVGTQSPDPDGSSDLKAGPSEISNPRFLRVPLPKLLDLRKRIVLPVCAHRRVRHPSDHSPTLAIADCPGTRL